MDSDVCYRLPHERLAEAAYALGWASHVHGSLALASKLFEGDLMLTLSQLRTLHRALHVMARDQTDWVEFRNVVQSALDRGKTVNAGS